MTPESFIVTLRTPSGGFEGDYELPADLPVERLSQLLLEGTLSVGEVARSCGYPDPLTFSKAFKRTLGVTPSQYQRGQAASGLVQASSVDTGGR